MVMVGAVCGNVHMSVIIVCLNPYSIVVKRHTTTAILIKRAFNWGLAYRFTLCPFLDIALEK